jgi:TATA-binding protein-associated factor
MLQKFLTAVIAEEWAKEYMEKSQTKAPLLLESSNLAQEITKRTLAWLQGKPPPAYHEMAFALSRIHADCIALLQMFATDCKLPMSSIPFLGKEIDISGTVPGRFTIETAQNAVGNMYTRLKDSLGRTRKKELAIIAEKRNAILASIDRYNEIKTQHDIRISAAFAAAFVAFKSTPDKVSPVVKGIMNGIKVGILVIFTLVAY